VDLPYPTTPGESGTLIYHLDELFCWSLIFNSEEITERMRLFLFLLSALLFAGATGPLRAETLYSVTAIGNLSHYDVTYGYALNNEGQVTGESYNPGASFHAFLYSDRSMQDLGTSGGDRSAGNGVNDQGQITGYADSLSARHAFLYADGQMQDLGTLGGIESVGYGINNQGQVTGSASTSSGAIHAFLYANGRMQDLGGLGGSNSYGRGINDRGQVTGYAYTTSDDQHAFLNTAGQMQDLGTLGGDYSVAMALNNAGQVTGYSYITGSSHASTNNLQHAFLYSNGQMQDLGTLGGGYSFGYGINDAGQVVGSSYLSLGGSHAFLYTNGQMRDLNSLIDPAPGLTLSVATAINNRGQVLAEDVYGSRGETRVYVLTPIAVPEPSSVTLCGIFGLLLFFARRSLQDMPDTH
jgi:probable HAF family extracellular repeat protein